MSTTAKETLAVLITGCNRGLGLEFVRQYVAEGHTVIAVVRAEPSEALKALKPAEILQCEMADHRNVKAVKAQLGDRPLDLVVLNAGFFPPAGKAETLQDKDFDRLEKAFVTNAITPYRLGAALASNLRAKPNGLKKLVLMSTRVASLGDNTTGGHTFYRTTKTALNMLGVSLKFDLPDITVIIQHPGWVRTEMGGPNGLIDAPESVAGMRKVFATEKRSGIFVDYTGKELPW